MKSIPKVSSTGSIRKGKTLTQSEQKIIAGFLNNIACGHKDMTLASHGDTLTLSGHDIAKRDPKTGIISIIIPENRNNCNTRNTLSLIPDVSVYRHDETILIRRDNKKAVKWKLGTWFELGQYDRNTQTWVGGAK